MSSKNSELELTRTLALPPSFIIELLRRLMNEREVQANRPNYLAAMVSVLPSLRGLPSLEHTVRLSLCQTTKPPVLSISIEAHIPLSFATGERLKERLPPLAEGTTTRGGR